MRSNNAPRSKPPIEAALRESEASYRALFDNAVVGIYRTTPDGRHLEVNPALARMRGCDTPASL